MDIALEGLLVADRDRWLGDWMDAPSIDAVRALAELDADFPGEERREFAVVEAGESADRLDVRYAQALLGARTHARQLANG
jgi:hypothetical protein